ncbi:MAG: type II toxin-antitoxin system VapC family toxin [Oligoflexia bacterium]|nr:type II toxin-antitoxin system VapC family toxin [Oligoflexia bacterium]
MTRLLEDQAQTRASVDAAFGLWRSRELDGLAGQEAARSYLAEVEGGAISLATARVHQRLLATRNTKDFPEGEPGICVPYRL